MSNPIPSQANVRTRSLAARADGSPITTGTVNYYLIANTGANAGKWFKTSDNTWAATEDIAGVMAHKADGVWSVSVDAEAWPTSGVEYTEYAKESGNLHVPTSKIIRCEYAATVIAPGAAGGLFIAGTNAETTVTTAINANLIGNITGNLSGTVGSVTTKTGYALTGDYDAAKTAAQAGNAMALTSGERTTLAAVIEGAILAEGDGNAVIAAIVAAIDAADIDVITASVIAAEVKSQMQAAGTHLTLIKAVTDALPDAGALTTIAADAARLTAERAAVLTDWINAGRLDAILDIIAADTTTDIPALIATAQSDLDTLTGTDGATLATTQGNYAPAVAGDKMDLIDSIMEDV